MDVTENHQFEWKKQQDHRHQNAQLDPSWGSQFSDKTIYIYHAVAYVSNYIPVTSHDLFIGNF